QRSVPTCICAVTTHLPEMRVELTGAVQFPRCFLRVPLLSQSLGQLVVSRSVLIGQFDRRTKLGNGAVHVSGGKHVLSGICRERCYLQIVACSRDARCRPSFFRRTGGVAKLAQHSGQSGVSSGKIGLQTNRLTKRGSG